MSISPGLFERQVRIEGLTEADIDACGRVAEDPDQHPERRLIACMTVLAHVDTQRWLREEAMERHRHEVRTDLMRLQRKHRGLSLAVLDLNAILRCLYLDWIESKSLLDRLIELHGPVDAVMRVDRSPDVIGRLRSEPMLPLIDRRRGGTVAQTDLFAELGRRITTWQAAQALFTEAEAQFNGRFNPKTDPLTSRILGFARRIDRHDALKFEVIREQMAINCAEIYRDMVRRQPIEAWLVAQDHIRNLHGELSDKTLRLWHIQRVHLAERIMADSQLTRDAQDQGVLHQIADCALLADDPFDRDLGL